MTFKRLFIRIELSIFLAVVLLLSCAPVPEEEKWYPDHFYPYDPQRAGAEIVASFDITESLMGNGAIIANSHDIAVHGDSIYIRLFSGLIYLYDINTLEYKSAIQLYYDGFLPEGIIFSEYEDILITDDFSVALVNSPQVITAGLVPPPYTDYGFIHAHLLFFDIDTGKIYHVVDVRDALGITSLERVNSIHGYDRESGLYWFRSGAFDAPFYYYSYHKKNNEFEFQYEKQGFTVGPWSNHHAESVALHGSTAWCAYIGNIWDRGLERRDINNTAKRLQTINFQNFGLQSSVYNQNINLKFAYDGEYIYFAVKDRYKNREIIKLLKIRPLD